jgi:hypothetical protein
VLITYGAGLRGEEVVKGDLKRTRNLLDESLAHPEKPHITVALLGRVKGEKDERCHLLPLALSSRLGLEYALWVHRLAQCYAALNIATGPLLRVIKMRKTVRARVADLDPAFHHYLRRVQQRWPQVLAPSVDIEAEFSLTRSGRRGSNSQSRNMKIPKSVVELNNHWRKRERSKGKIPVVGMYEHYLDVRVMAPALCEFSESL